MTFFVTVFNTVVNNINKIRDSKSHKVTKGFIKYIEKIYVYFFSIYFDVLLCDFVTLGV